MAKREQASYQLLYLTCLNGNYFDCNSPHLSALQNSFSRMNLEDVYKMEKANHNKEELLHQFSVDDALSYSKQAANTARKNFAKAALRAENKLKSIHCSRLKILRRDMINERMKRFSNTRLQEIGERSRSSVEEGYLAEERRKVIRIEGECSRGRHRVKEHWKKLRKQKDFSSAQEIPSTVISNREKAFRSLTKDLEKYELHDVAKELLLLFAIKEKTEKEYLKEIIKERKNSFKTLKGLSGDRTKKRRQLMIKREQNKMLDLPRLQRNANDRSEVNHGKTPHERVLALLSYQHPELIWREIQQTAYSINLTRPFTFSYFPKPPKQKQTQKGLNKPRIRRPREI